MVFGTSIFRTTCSIGTKDGSVGLDLQGMGWYDSVPKEPWSSTWSIIWGPICGYFILGRRVVGWPRCRLGGCAITFAMSRRSFWSSTWTSVGRMVSWPSWWLNLNNGGLNPPIHGNFGNLHGEHEVLKHERAGYPIFWQTCCETQTQFATLKFCSTL